MNVLRYGYNGDTGLWTIWHKDEIEQEFDKYAEYKRYLLVHYGVDE
jgi:hypothetical protein